MVIHNSGMWALSLGVSAKYVSYGLTWSYCNHWLTAWSSSMSPVPSPMLHFLLSSRTVPFLFFSSWADPCSESSGFHKWQIISVSYSAPSVDNQTKISRVCRKQFHATYRKLTRGVSGDIRTITHVTPGNSLAVTQTGKCCWVGVRRRV